MNVKRLRAGCGLTHIVLARRQRSFRPLSPTGIGRRGEPDACHAAAAGEGVEGIGGRVGGIDQEGILESMRIPSEREDF